MKSFVFENSPVDHRTPLSECSNLVLSHWRPPGQEEGELVAYLEIFVDLEIQEYWTVHIGLETMKHPPKN